MSLARAEKADFTDGGSPSRPSSSPMPSGSAPMPPGGVFFVTAARRAEACAELRARRYLVVAAPPRTPGEGGLRQVIDDAVEGALALRGAVPPGAPIDADAEATARDQVLRARALGTAGLVLAFPLLFDDGAASDPLSQSALDRPLLNLDDGEVVSAWIAAAQRGSVVILLDERDRDARVLAPQRLAEIASSMKAPLCAPPSSSSDAPPALAKDSIPPSGELEKAPAEPAPATVKEGALQRATLALLRPTAKLPAEDEPPTLRHQPKAAGRRGVLQKRSRAEATVAEPAAAAKTPEADEPARETRATPNEEPAPASAQIRSAAEATPANENQTVVEPEVVARRIVHAAEWRAHAVELDKARGPKPVSVIDKLFTTRYMPLLGALARGEVDGGVKSVIDAFRTNFEHSYREAFSALRITGKRPPMVFDAPDLASRLGRLNGARAVKLLLVDAMRFDIGERVASRLGERLTGRAVCVERTLLWAAIPTTTQTQMTLLSRGQEGLREAEPPLEPEAEIVRGRAVGTVRRERIGAREVMKLDVVEARLRTAGAGYEDRIEGLAEEVAQITSRYVETLPPRTLLFIFGDHGFRLPAGQDGRSTGTATQGGVSPEEVLVPAHAWLIGGVH
jgi:hypothetical protein